MNFCDSLPFLVKICVECIQTTAHLENSLISKIPQMETFSSVTTSKYGAVVALKWTPNVLTKRLLIFTSFVRWCCVMLNRQYLAWNWLHAKDKNASFWNLFAVYSFVYLRTLVDEYDKSATFDPDYSWTLFLLFYNLI